MDFARITADTARMGGVPCIRNLRIPVATVVDMVADGMSTGEILKAYPDLEPDDIREPRLSVSIAAVTTSTGMPSRPGSAPSVVSRCSRAARSM